MPFPPGHFYSPVVDATELRRREAELWPVEVPEIPGVDFRPHEQLVLLRRLAPFIAEFDFPREPAPGTPRFHESNPAFSGLDSRLLFGVIRAFAPSRLIEIGGGWTTLLIAEVNRRWFDASILTTCIEPYPAAFLRGDLEGLSELLVERAERVSVSRYLELGPNDVLFIDSSHVAKTGSDVTYLLLEVLPRLHPGVLVHVHDVFLPFDYPKRWVLEEERSWNEQYVLRALLTFSSAFEIILASNYLHACQPDALCESLGAAYGGGSLWLRRSSLV